MYKTTTIPPFSFDEHISSLVAHLKKYHPRIDKDLLLFFNYFDFQPDQKSILRDKLMSYQQCSVLFEELCNQGHSWINLSGDSWYQKKFLVSVEYSIDVSSPTCAIVVSGPTLDISHTPLKETRFVILPGGFSSNLKNPDGR